MTTFAAQIPITKQILLALHALREARRDGDATKIYVANEQLRRKLELLPTPTRGLAETHPELDKHLRVTFKR